MAFSLDGTDLAFHLPPGSAPEGMIGSIIGLLGLDLVVPDHSTLGRRAATLQVIPRPGSGIGPVHLLVDSTGLKLCGPGEWLVKLANGLIEGINGMVQAAKAKARGYRSISNLKAMVYHPVAGASP